MDELEARVLVYNIVVSWIGRAVGIAPKRVNVSRGFGGAPPAGYGFNEGMYIRMCEEITPSIAAASGRAFTLPGKWRLDHASRSIGVFINDAAGRLLQSRETATAKYAREYAENYSP
ncbi:hypothetical protein HL667_10665 [Bradyrhizobium sp. 83012]|uniref:Uncharacterized protein n=1 Tax=Bradyrhizobium aeschynomenes TaxID=2734909 RepID=A0ABX2CCR7_9BRAD|nr:hypothetical protein [Bradyrhizobium aeschynomenes]NPU65455.1 hypothetical protein [Bradyrhizobium aeschynomenes]